MLRPSGSTITLRALRLKCPRCGGAPMFAGLFRMHETCAHCHLKFEREPGYFLGSIYINYGITALIVTVGWITLRFGYMESPSVPRILAKARKHGVDFDIMQTSFFLARFQVKPARPSSMPAWQHLIFTGLARLANDATDFFDIPSGRVIWLGGQITI